MDCVEASIFSRKQKLYIQNNKLLSDNESRKKKLKLFMITNQETDMYIARIGALSKGLRCKPKTVTDCIPYNCLFNFKCDV